MKLKEWVVIYVAAFWFTVGDWIKGRWKREDNECW
nr:MAG TPA: hypothetical protein [Caudovirales sp. ct8Ze27]